MSIANNCFVRDKEQLLDRARKASENSYSPYSKFRVGAAIRSEDGRIFTGTNIENASYSMTMCAERVAIFKAISEGSKIFTDIAIVSSSKNLTFPCGACRQVMLEFSPDLHVHLDGDSFLLSDLLPHGFSKDALNE
jgi:cytidine deaminase